jgi:hypothetical protein
VAKIGRLRNWRTQQTVSSVKRRTGSSPHLIPSSSPHHGPDIIKSLHSHFLASLAAQFLAPGSNSQRPRHLSLRMLIGYLGTEQQNNHSSYYCCPWTEVPRTSVALSSRLLPGSIHVNSFSGSHITFSESRAMFNALHGIARARAPLSSPSLLLRQRVQVPITGSKVLFCSLSKISYDLTDRCVACHSFFPPWLPLVRALSQPVCQQLQFDQYAKLDMTDWFYRVR